MAWYALPRDLSLSPGGKLLQQPVQEAVILRKQQSTFPAMAPGSQVENGPSSTFLY
jgi:sucrose-6-phosphate hydrolase SacC (GH32 family)